MNNNSKIVEMKQLDKPTFWYYYSFTEKLFNK